MSLSEIEFEVLRRTIASRGTARMVLLPVAILGWACLAAAVLAAAVPPAGALFSLMALMAGFEAVHALHVGAERIGRYLRVFYEDTPAGPHWETVVTAVGPALPGGGVDSLFSLIFASAAVANYLPLLVRPSSTTTISIAGVLHLTFLVRIIRARRAGAQQRVADGESFRALRANDSSRSR